jgi:hypothetical protein
MSEELDIKNLKAVIYGADGRCTETQTTVRDGYIIIESGHLGRIALVKDDNFFQYIMLGAFLLAIAVLLILYKKGKFKNFPILRHGSAGAATLQRFGNGKENSYKNGNEKENSYKNGNLNKTDGIKNYGNSNKTETVNPYEKGKNYENFDGVSDEKRKNYDVISDEKYEEFIIEAIDGTLNGLNLSQNQIANNGKFDLKNLEKNAEFTPKNTEKNAEFTSKNTEKNGEFTSKNNEKNGNFTPKNAEKNADFASKNIEKNGEFAEEEISDDEYQAAINEIDDVIKDNSDDNTGC